MWLWKLTWTSPFVITREKADMGQWRGCPSLLRQSIQWDLVGSGGLVVMWKQCLSCVACQLDRCMCPYFCEWPHILPRNQAQTTNHAQSWEKGVTPGPTTWCCLGYRRPGWIQTLENRTEIILSLFPWTRVGIGWLQIRNVYQYIYSHRHDPKPKRKLMHWVPWYCRIVWPLICSLLLPAGRVFYFN